jgi:hypothetical protein
VLDARDFHKVNAAADNHVVYQPNIRRWSVSRKAETGLGTLAGFSNLDADIAPHAHSLNILAPRPITRT